MGNTRLCPAARRGTQHRTTGPDDSTVKIRDVETGAAPHRAPSRGRGPIPSRSQSMAGRGPLAVGRTHPPAPRGSPEAARSWRSGDPGQTRRWSSRGAPPLPPAGGGAARWGGRRAGRRRGLARAPPEPGWFRRRMECQPFKIRGKMAGPSGALNSGQRSAPHPKRCTRHPETETLASTRCHAPGWSSSFSFRTPPVGTDHPRTPTPPG